MNPVARDAILTVVIGWWFLIPAAQWVWTKLVGQKPSMKQ